MDGTEARGECRGLAKTGAARFQPRSLPEGSRWIPLVKMAGHGASRPCSPFPRVPFPPASPALAGRAQAPRPLFRLGAKSGGGNERETKAHARPLPSRPTAAGKRPCSQHMRALALRYLRL